MNEELKVGSCWKVLSTFRIPLGSINENLFFFFFNPFDYENYLYNKGALPNHPEAWKLNIEEKTKPIVEFTVRIPLEGAAIVVILIIDDVCKESILQK